MRMLMTGLAALILWAGAALADPVEGLWRTEPGDTGGYLHVQISACGNEICGVIRKAYDKNGQERHDYEHLGKQMIWGMKPAGDGSYRGGKIWAPDRNKTYKAKMALNGRTLSVKGCVAIFCRGQTWSRVQ